MVYNLAKEEDSECDLFLHVNSLFVLSQGVNAGVKLQRGPAYATDLIRHYMSEIPRSVKAACTDDSV